MKFITTLVLSALLYINAQAHADCRSCYDSYYYEGDQPCWLQDCSGDKFYAEIFGGADFIHSTPWNGINIDYKTGYDVSASYGYRLCYGFRMEAEYAFRRDEVKSNRLVGTTARACGHFQSSSYMANLLWNLSLRRWGICLKPFVGGGVGYDAQQIRAKGEGLSIRSNKKGFSWQGIAGISYPFCRNMEISVEYKFHQGPYCELYNQTVGIGLTYTFCGCN